MKALSHVKSILKRHMQECTEFFFKILILLSKLNNIRKQLETFLELSLLLSLSLSQTHTYTHAHARARWLAGMRSHTVNPLSSMTPQTPLQDQALRQTAVQILEYFTLNVYTRKLISRSSFSGMCWYLKTHWINVCHNFGSTRSIIYQTGVNRLLDAIASETVERNSFQASVSANWWMQVRFHHCELSLCDAAELSGRRQKRKTTQNASCVKTRTRLQVDIFNSFP